MNRADPASAPTGSGLEHLRLLLVMDEQPLTRMVAFALNHGVHTQRIERTLEGAQRAVVEMRPHLAIIDIGADGGRVLALVDGVPGEQRLPIIALTHRGDLMRELAVLDRGADDIIAVPFMPAELISRVHALVRRIYGQRAKIVPVVQVGDLKIDILNRQVSAGKMVIRLTALEQALLYLLAANCGAVVTRDAILDAIWGTDFVTETNIVDRHIGALRAKLKDDASKPRYIQTVPGVGYKFVG